MADLPAGRTPRHSPGDRVAHAEHGAGTVAVVNIRSVMVEFDRGGPLVVMPEDLTAGGAPAGPDAAAWAAAVAALWGAVEAEVAALAALFDGPAAGLADHAARLGALAARAAAARRAVDALRRGAGG